MVVESLDDSELDATRESAAEMLDIVSELGVEALAEVGGRVGISDSSNAAPTAYMPMSEVAVLERNTSVVGRESELKTEDIVLVLLGVVMPDAEDITDCSIDRLMTVEVDEDNDILCVERVTVFGNGIKP